MTNELIQVIAIIALVVAVLGLIVFIARRIRRVPPNEALIIVGRGAGKAAPGETVTGQRVVIGGRTFVWPILQQGFAISLEQRQIGITVEGVDKNRIKIAIKASINFKVSGTEEGVRRAGQRFLSQQGALTEIIKESLEGSLRSIIGDMTIEQIISDRKGLSDRVVAETKADLVEQGLQVDLLNISDISTPGSDYLANLGRAEAARARQVAEVSEAEASRASEFARIEAAEQIAERQKALSLRQASIKAETDRANAEAQASGQLATAEQDKLVAVQEREALTEQALVTQERLDIEVRKPAEAQAYAEVQRATAQRDAANAATEADAFKRTKIAEANKVAAVQDAEASATAVRFAGEAERDRQVALAAGVRAEGDARASAIQAEGLATAAATDAKALALQKYGEAALAQEIISRLPEIVAAAAAPIGNIDKLTVVSTDGASEVTKTVGKVLGEGTEVVKNLTGLDLTTLMQAFTGKALDVPVEAVARAGAAKKASKGAAAPTDPAV
ncbi:flotillin family protein [Microbacterium sp.]|uniref:flotillin family protein n=1 Tax=Microbacterium sp. TaxID=51671 RepID=UPI003F6FE207